MDSNYICHWHRFALSQGLSYRGKPTEIIFGFLKTVFELSERFQSRRFLFCWDSRESLRKKIYPDYKSNRHKEMTEEEKETSSVAFRQFDEIRQIVLPDLGFKNIFLKDGYESDDLIAVLVKMKSTDTKVVVSSDADLYQLLQYCNIYQPAKKQLMTEELFQKEYSIASRYWPSVKCLSGCSTDNVAGIVGVGEKTAIKYFNGELVKGKAFDSIKSKEGVKIFHRNALLVSLPFDGIDVLPVKKQEIFSKDKFIQIFEQYGFQSFLTAKAISRWTSLFNLE
ncbi:MAG: hypothetical protein WC302_00760 [Candidatus Paceibacterota bacterium]